MVLLELSSPVAEWSVPLCSVGDTLSLAISRRRGMVAKLAKSKAGQHSACVFVSLF